MILKLLELEAKDTQGNFAMPTPVKPEYTSGGDKPTDEEKVLKIRTTVEVIRELKEDEVLLVTVSGGALTEQSIDAIEGFIVACHDPSQKTPGALLLEADWGDEFYPGPPASIKVSVVKQSDVSKGIAIKEEGD